MLVVETLVLIVALLQEKMEIDRQMHVLQLLRARHDFGMQISQHERDRHACPWDSKSATLHADEYIRKFNELSVKQGDVAHRLAVANQALKDLSTA